MAEEHLGTTSHGGEKLLSYTTYLKSQAVEYAKQNKNRESGRKYKMAPKTIREWRAKKEKFNEQHQNRTPEGKRLRLDGGAGGNITDNEIEENLLKWIAGRWGNGLRVSFKLRQRTCKRKISP